MSGTTAVEGYPYPLPADFADVQDPYRLATAIDADIRSVRDPFRAFVGRPSFIFTQTSNGSSFLSGMDFLLAQSVQWDNTGGVTIGQGTWRQPLSQPPSWWLFGATVLSFNPVGATVGDMVMGGILVTTTDQVSAVATTTEAWQRSDETNTNGEWLNVFTMAQIYRGSAIAALEVNGGTSKGLSAGSTFWGVYMGPVN
jgi:hypothetical protein